MILWNKPYSAKWRMRVIDRISFQFINKTRTKKKMDLLLYSRATSAVVQSKNSRPIITFIFTLNATRLKSKGRKFSCQAFADHALCRCKAFCTEAFRIGCYETAEILTPHTKMAETNLCGFRSIFVMTSTFLGEGWEEKKWIGIKFEN